MGQLADLAMVGSFAYAGWQILGKWYNLVASNNKRFDTVTCLEWFDNLLAEMKKQGKRESDLPGLSSTQSQLFADWKKLTVSQKVQLVSDLEDLARWSGQFSGRRPLHGPKKSWKALNDDDRKRLLVIIDQLKFDFIQEVVNHGQKVANDVGIWQVCEPLPLLAAEPHQRALPVAQLEALKQHTATNDERVKGALDETRRLKISQLQGPVKELKVVEAVRKLQALKEVVQQELKMNTKGKTDRIQQLQELGQSLELVPQAEGDREAKGEAGRRLDEDVQQKTKALAEKLSQERDDKVQRIEVTELEKQVTTRLGNSPSSSHLVQLAELMVERIRTSDASQMPFLLVILGRVVSRLDDGGELGTRMTTTMNELGTQAFGDHPEKEDEEPHTVEQGEEGDQAEEEQEKVVPATKEELLMRLTDILKEVNTPQEEEAEQEGGGEGGGEEGGREGGEEGGEEPEDVSAAVLAAVHERANSVRGQLEEQHRQQIQQEAAKQKLLLVKERLANAVTASKNLGDDGKMEEVEEKEDDDAPAEGAYLPSGLELVLYRELALKDLAGSAMKTADFVQQLAGFLEQHGALADDVEVESTSKEAEEKLRQLLSEVQLIEAVEKLEPGPGLVDTLKQLGSYVSGNSSDESAEAGGKVSSMTEELLHDGLVLLELSPLQYKKLGQLREIVENTQPDMDATLFEKNLQLLKDITSQHLGSIGGEIGSRLEQAADEEVGKLLEEQNSRAQNIYGQLQSMFTHNDLRRRVMNLLNQIKELVSSLVIQPTSSALSGTHHKLSDIQAALSTIVGAVNDLPERNGNEAVGDEEDLNTISEGSKSSALEALKVLISSVAAMEQAVKKYEPYIMLREEAMHHHQVASAGEEPRAEETVPLEEFTDSVTIQFMKAQDKEPEQEEWGKEGMRAIAKGRVAAVLLAGSTIQGHARGVLDIGLMSQKCLFQLYAERILRLQRLAAEATFGPRSGVRYPVFWYIITSEATHEEISSFLKEQNYFGLDAAQVVLCKYSQPSFCLSEDLQLVMESPFKLAHPTAERFPEAEEPTEGEDGAAKPSPSYTPVTSGDVFEALRVSGALRQMQIRGVQSVEVCTTEDNLLWKVADPDFIGYCRSHDYQCGVKLHEPSRTSMAYSIAEACVAGDEELTDAVRSMMPSLGVYYFSMNALKKVVDHYRSNPLAGYRLTPQGITKQEGKGNSAVEGYKFDRYLTDIFAVEGLDLGLVGLVGVEAEAEYALVWGTPLFPLPGEVAVDDMLNLHTSWVENSGGEVKCELGVEVSPLVSYAGEGLQEVCQGKVFEQGYDLVLEGATIPSEEQTTVGPWVVPFGLAYLAVASLKIVKAMGKQ